MLEIEENTSGVLFYYNILFVDYLSIKVLTSKKLFLYHPNIKPIIEVYEK